MAACAVASEREAATAPEPVTMADLPTKAADPTPPSHAEPEPKPAAEPTPEPPAPQPERVGPSKLLPLPDAQSAIFQASVQDDAAELRLGVTKALHGKHYLAGNEKTLQAFYPHVRDAGGGYVGVGSDQAYLMIGWIKPEVAWLIDYDPAVVSVHSVYRVFFENTETPAELLELWTAEHKKRAAEMILAAHDGERGKELRRLYLQNRGWINRRLKAVTKRLVKAKVPSYLNDQDQFDYVRSMLEAGRVRPLLANLLKDKGVRGVGAAATEMNVPINVLYLSNAEEYWKQYPPEFRENIASLPFADSAKILRTLLIWEVNEDYRYNVQPAKNFGEWLAQPYTKNVYDIVHARGRPDKTIINFFETDEPPAQSPAARRAGS